MLGVAGANTLGIASCLSAVRQVSLTSGFRFHICTRKVLQAKAWLNVLLCHGYLLLAVLNINQLVLQPGVHYLLHCNMIRRTCQEWLFHSNMTNSVNGGLLQYFLLHKMQPYHNAIYC